MKIQVTFISIPDAHHKRQPGINTPRLSVNRFHELLEKGVFGPNAKVTYRPFKSGIDVDRGKVVGLEYTVTADEVSNDFFLERVLDIAPKK